MENALKKQFPIIRDREEVLFEIHNNPELRWTFYSWDEKNQKEFLDFCTGVKGVKLLYDRFFKAVFDPTITPERLEEVLSLILDTKVKIIKVLPNESTRIAAEYTLLILDIVVELEDGSIANVEAQKIGYRFPGQRSACYSADLLLRQYKRVKGEKGKRFKYKDIKKVYTIVFLEESTQEFHKKAYRENDIYVHRSKQQANTGLKIELLQEYIFIALDILRDKADNKGINNDNKLEAWLLFLSEDNPERIIELIEKYPEFRALYEEVYKMCQNMEDIMGIFSEELAILDRNTVLFMIDEMEERAKELEQEIKEREKELGEREKEICEREKEIREQEKEICERDKEICERDKEICEREKEICERDKEIREQAEEIREKEKRIQELEVLLAKQTKDE